MNIKRMISAAFIAATLSAAAHASIVEYNAQGYAAGIDDIVIDGTNYDVSFVGGKYNTIYASQAPTFLNNSQGSLDAESAILAVLQGQPTMPLLNSELAEGRPVGDLYIPFELSGTFDARQVGYSPTSTLDDWQLFGFAVGLVPSVTYGSTGQEFTVFTPLGLASVPEPSSLALVPIAMLGLYWSRSRQRRGQKIISGS